MCPCPGCGPKNRHFLVPALRSISRETDFVSISNRSKPPHIVSLTNAGRQRAVKLVEDFVANNNGEYKSKLHDAEEALKERLIYRLRQNYCKLRRRRENRKADDCDEQNKTSDESSGASVPWLVKKCPKELHMFARLQPNRPMDVLPLSKEWNLKTESILLDFITRHADAIFVVGEHKENVRASVGLVQSLRGEEEDEGGSNSIDLEGTCTKLVSILRERGNAVGGLDVGNIMTDEKMRRLLGGRDLTTVVRGNSAAFDSSVEMYQDEQRNNVWYCRLTDFDFADTNNDAWGSKRKKHLLHADEVGTYSLTDATSALAMAKVLANNMTTGEKSKAEESRVAIDMTAGVGGNTMGLCKIFPKVIAYEIDSSRIEFLKQNVEERAGASNVDISLRCGDSLLALDSLLAELRSDGLDGSKQAAVIIDPPFGGIHYRRQGSKMVPNGNQGDDDDYDEEGLKLGDMPLSEVVKTVMGKLNPSAIGLKLPLSFDVDRFAKRLAGVGKGGNGAGSNDDNNTSADVEEMNALKVRAIRRLARNLFVVVGKSE